MTWEPTETEPTLGFVPQEIEGSRDVYVLVKIPVFGIMAQADKVVEDLTRKLEVQMGSDIKTLQISTQRGVEIEHELWP